MSYDYKNQYKSGAAKGLEMKMEYWEKKDWNMEFNILTAQALNLAVEKMYSDPKAEWTQTLDEMARDFFFLLLELRKDNELRKAFEDFKTPPPIEYPKPPKTEPKEFKPSKKPIPKIEDLKFVESGEVKVTLPEDEEEDLI